MERQLFGHEAGAFTHARRRRISKLEHANGGTLFLDEVESIPMAAQVRLPRVLQERVLERLGSDELISLDLRVVAATKIDLREAAEAREFREDLFYRLNGVTLEIPPLRERREDIQLLFHHFLLVANHRHQREAVSPKPEQIAALLAHDWPGNVRELRNLAERYVLLGEACGWSIEKLLVSSESAIPASLPQQLEQYERMLIEQALAANRGSIKAAMAMLAVPRKTLYDKMRKYGLDKSDQKKQRLTAILAGCAWDGHGADLGGIRPIRASKSVAFRQFRDELRGRYSTFPYRFLNSKVWCGAWPQLCRRFDQLSSQDWAIKSNKQ